MLLPEKFNRLLALTGLAVLAGASGAMAQNGDSDRHFRVYGHFTPAIVSFGDGSDFYTHAADNSYSGGRIGFWLDFPMQERRLRFNLETSLGLRQSASITQTEVPPLFDLGAWTLRKLEMVYDTATLGALSFGMGSMATDHITESDLSGTQLASYVGFSDTAGGYFFRTGTGTLSDIDINQAFPTFDGGRAPRIRWDSPDLSVDWLGTFNMAASVGIEVVDGNLTINDALGDVGLFYRNRIGSVEVKASGGLSIAEVDGTQQPQAAGSFSMLHAPSGWNATVAAGTRNNGGQYYYAKLGLKRRWLEWGNTSASIDIYRGANTVAQGSMADSYGIGIVQAVDRVNLNFYLGLRRYDLSSPGTVSYHPSHSIIFGTRWVFKRLENGLFRSGRREVDWADSD